MILHGGLAALRLDGEWRGLLLVGPSGSGKSDLLLRASEAGFRPVADDRVVIWTVGDRLYGRAPDTLRDLMESRGLGVLPAATLPFSEIVLAVRCEASPEAVERFPQGETLSLLDRSVPLRPLWPFDPSAPAKLRRAMQHLGYDH
ncbi:HPr kinase/phosphorylase [Caulobacter mirabilis]|uniref:Serine kinase n=1 Tax=Caulobacter mirabilis TaxID=69666 RepID=A0A2D2B2G9_9CAUL|nr:serine kinase [Caulobacter mirabilis]ATQ44406.1 serine kinase [Caulobacter mirabilis]